jgi:uncharacterized membrane protein
MSTKNRSQKAKNGSSQQVVRTEPPDAVVGIGKDILPGTGPIAERIQRVTAQRTTFNGPIPHPDIFRKYGEVIPDAPERILKVFEEDSKHARDIEVAALNAQKGDNKRVHWMAWSLIAGGYALALIFAYLDKDTLAGLVLTTTLAGTIVGFFQNRQEQKKNEDQ